MRGMKRGRAVAYSAGILFVCLGVVLLLAAQNGTWQGEALAQALEINVNTSQGVLAVTANLAEGELLSIEVMGPGSKFVVDEDVASSSFMWAPGAGDPDGLYRYEIQVVDKEAGIAVGRKAGTFSIRFGQIVMPKGQDGKRLQGSLPSLTDTLRRCAEAVVDFIVPQAEAVDFTVSDASPEIFFDDTNDGDDWRIFTNHNVDGLGLGSMWRLFKGGGTAVIDIRADEATYSTNLLSSLVIDSAGNLYFADNGMVFDRANSRLGINTTTPAFRLDVIGNRMRLRNSPAAGAKTIQMRTDGSWTDLQVENSDLLISTLAAIHNIYLSSNRVGVGTTEPDSKLHVIGASPPQFIVQNEAGNARMDFRRSSAIGVSQLLFGTGSLSGGTMDYQIGMFLDTTFQIRVTNDSARGIALTTGGNVGIGKTAPAAKLDVAGVVNASGGYTSISDVRLKENIAPIESALGKVMALEGVSFTWKKDQKVERGLPDGTHYGVVAQQAERVVPAVVREGNDGEKAVSYTELVPVLIEAIKEQQKTIGQQLRVMDMQQKSIDEQRKAMEEQQRTIVNLTEKMDEIRRLVLLKGAIAGVTGE